MFKINSYSLFLLTTLCLNSSNVHAFWSTSLNNNTAQLQQSLFPDILTIESSTAPQPDQWHFNSSTHTFIPPLMLSGWENNMSTGTFSINSFCLPITNDSISSNMLNIGINQNNNTALPIVHETQQQELSHTNQNKDHALSESKKTKKVTKTFTCPTCNKTLANQSSFKYHLRTHTPNRERPYKCNLCNKSFAEKSILKIHIKRHSKEKPFKCDFCSKSFNTKYEKTRHHYVHTGKKPFQCDFCAKCFVTKYK